MCCCDAMVMCYYAPMVLCCCFDMLLFVQKVQEYEVFHCS